MIYLDHAATTRPAPEVLEAMLPFYREHFGNASSLYSLGRESRRAVEEARELAAAFLGCRPQEIVFTSGGSESDNLALRGVLWALRERGDHLVTTQVEHHAVLHAARALEQQGFRVTYLSPDRHGRVSAAQVEAAITDRTTLISVMHGNNEVGTLQPVAELAAVAREHGIPFHTDAVQAAGALEVDFAASGADALSISGHKIGGPMGVAALLLTKGVAPVPVLHGGGQERDVRSGTLDAPAIAGLAAAVQVTAGHDRAAHARDLAVLRDELIGQVRAAVPDAILNGDPVHRLPGNAHFSFPGCEGDALLMLLDARGIACSTGSACSAGVSQPSHVLLAMGADAARARGSLRFTLGHTSVPADVEALAQVIGPVVERARRAGLT